MAVDAARREQTLDDLKAASSSLEAAWRRLRDAGATPAAGASDEETADSGDAAGLGEEAEDVLLRVKQLHDRIAARPAAISR